MCLEAGVKGAQPVHQPENQKRVQEDPGVLASHVEGLQLQQAKAEVDKLIIDPCTTLQSIYTMLPDFGRMGPGIATTASLSLAFFGDFTSSSSLPECQAQCCVHALLLLQNVSGHNHHLRYNTHWRNTSKTATAICKSITRAKLLLQHAFSK